MDKTLKRTLVDATSVLKKHGFQYALIGGLAASIRGRTRTTEDVGIVIQSEISEALQFLTVLVETMLTPLFPDVQAVIRRSYILPLRHQETGVTIDLAIGASGFEHQVIARATDIKISSRSIRVATAEDILLMKIMAGRPQDNQDIDGIVIAQGAHLDWGYCRKVGQQLQDALGIDLVRQINDLEMRSQL